MTHFALAIDQTTNDLFLDASGNLAVVQGAQAVGQHCRQRLKTFAGEWFLDTSAGVPWIDEIFQKKYDPIMAEAIIKEQIFDTSGVTGIEDFNVSLDSVTRNLLVKRIKVQTIYEGVVLING